MRIKVRVKARWEARDLDEDEGVWGVPSHIVQGRHVRRFPTEDALWVPRVPVTGRHTCARLTLSPGSLPLLTLLLTLPTASLKQHTLVGPPSPPSGGVKVLLMRDARLGVSCPRVPPTCHPRGHPPHRRIFASVTQHTPRGSSLPRTLRHAGSESCRCR